MEMLVNGIVKLEIVNDLLMLMYCASPTHALYVVQKNGEKFKKNNAKIENKWEGKGN